MSTEETSVETAETVTTDVATPVETAMPAEATSKGELVPLEVQEADNISPVRPEFVTPERDAELKAQAERIVASILENPTDATVTAEVYGVGGDAMGSNTDNVSLLDTKIGAVMAEVEVGSSVGKSLVEIKTQLDLINPSVVSNTEAPFEEKLLGLFKRTVFRLPKGDEVLMHINERRDTVSTTIDALKRHLWKERDLALRNAIELGTIANRLADTQEDLQEAAYSGQLIWHDLNEARTKVQNDPVTEQALTNLVNDIAILVVDIQTVDTLNVQSRLGGETLINNCRRIEQGVSRVTNVLLPAVATNLGIKAAAAQQARLTQSLGEISDAASNTIADTAKQIKQTTTQMARLQSEAMIDVDKLEVACDEFVQMTEELEQIRAETEAKARETSQGLNRLASVMRHHADPLTTARHAREQAGV